MKEFTKWELGEVGVIYTSQLIWKSQSKHVGVLFRQKNGGGVEVVGPGGRGWEVSMWIRAGYVCLAFPPIPRNLTFHTVGNGFWLFGGFIYVIIQARKYDQICDFVLEKYQNGKMRKKVTKSFLLFSFLNNLSEGYSQK